MTDSDRETEPAPAAELLADMPLPGDSKTIFLGGLFVLALLAAAFFASEIVLPMVFAFILKLLLQPIFRFLERLRIPRALAALLLILALFGTIVGLGTAISGPAGDWAAKLPDGVPRLEERMSFLRGPIERSQQFLQQIENIGAAGAQPQAVSAGGGSAVLATIFAGTRSFASGLLTTVLFLYFLLVSGDTFLRRLVEILPRFSSKRQAVDISQQIESDVSAYLLTISIMNAAVGIATALVMWLTGVGDPILWGTLAFLLNYAPILGPAVGVGIFLFAGLLTIDNLWQALLPAALYLAIHIVEGETATPMLLARRFTLNLSSSFSRSSSGSGCGAFPARSSPCRCWRSPRSFATGFAHSPRLVTFSKGEGQAIVEASRDRRGVEASRQAAHRGFFRVRMIAALSSPP